jgi:flagellin
LEVNALLAEIDKIASNTRFNDVKLLDGAYDQTIRAGNTNAETIRVSIDALSTVSTAKITQFASETAALETGQTYGNGAAFTYNNANAATARTAMFTAGFGNLSADGSDGADADGSDTDLTVRDGTGFEIDTSVFSSSFKEKFKGDSLGTFTLVNHTAGDASVLVDTTATDIQFFDIDAKTGKVTLKAGQDIDYVEDTNVAAGNAASDATKLAKAKANYHTFHVRYQTRAEVAAGGTTNGHFEHINLVVTEAAEIQLDDVKVESSTEATRAVETLDKALEEVSSAQAKLGAIQNRLQHNIDNLSKSAMLTEQSVGRVTDADFATETSNLSKQQILNQAATAMLAQANQSKQSVLSLLQ